MRTRNSFNALTVRVMNATCVGALRTQVMLRLALFFLVVSLVAALFGFGGISAASADIARILFFVAIVVFLVLLVAGLMAGSTLF